MSVKKKNGSKNGCISKDVQKAAEKIAALNGENFDALVAQFTTDYVMENIHLLLTDKVQLSASETKE